MTDRLHSPQHQQPLASTTYTNLNLVYLSLLIIVSMDLPNIPSVTTAPPLDENTLPVAPSMPAPRQTRPSNPLPPVANFVDYPARPHAAAQSNAFIPLTLDLRTSAIRDPIGVPLTRFPPYVGPDGTTYMVQYLPHLIPRSVDNTFNDQNKRHAPTHVSQALLGARRDYPSRQTQTTPIPRLSTPSDHAHAGLPDASSANSDRLRPPDGSRGAQPRSRTFGQSLCQLIRTYPTNGTSPTGSARTLRKPPYFAQPHLLLHPGISTHSDAAHRSAT